MLIDREYHPELVVTKDITRYVLQHAYVTDELTGVAGKGWLVATDGRIAMFVPVQLAASDKLGMVRSDLCQLAKRAGGKGPYDIRLGARYIRTRDGILYPRLHGQGRGTFSYPDLGKQLEGLHTATLPLGRVGLVNAQLTRLLKGLGAETAILEFHGAGPCRVKVSNNPSFGLIMPTRD